MGKPTEKKPVFIATYDEYTGTGATLEQAFDELKDNTNDRIDIEDCTFYEATEIKVEAKIVKIEVPVLVG